ncbi:MAG: transketolase family protein [Anaerovoracaceae bacterium]
MVKFTGTLTNSDTEMRKAYCDTLIEEAEKNDNIVMINCDLCSSMGLKPFRAKFPERSINVGIEEANGVSMAGGLSAAGMVPFFNSFSVFASRRVYDQIFMSCAYPKLNVKIMGGDAGVSATNNGGTHMPFEDMGILRTMPGVTVIEPSDPVQMKFVVKEIANTYGVHYVRFTRKNPAALYEEGSDFEIGKAVVHSEGKDVTIIACGLEVAEALKAADILESEGISATVIDMFTIKPIDRECIVKYAKETGAVVTAENHQITNGLGSAVAEVLAEDCPTPMERIGARDEFGEVGPQDYLMERFALTAPHIAEAARKVIKKKSK